jgi:hypothetical protein
MLEKQITKRINLSLSRALSQKEKDHLAEWKKVIEKRLAAAVRPRNSLAKHEALMQKITKQRDDLAGKASTGLDSKSTQDHEAVLMQIRLLGATIDRTQADAAELAENLRHCLNEASAAICAIQGKDLTEQYYALVEDALEPFFESRAQARGMAPNTHALRLLGMFLNPQFMASDIEFLAQQAERLCVNIDALIEGKILWSHGPAAQAATA